ncbi:MULTISPECIES: PAS domain-containing sensor histidine kinase [Sphingobacterium]|uniref:histidine kinase n=1 Tax=Sphingobacterium populi TaxID=1812824 RepID=A0ABW5UF86_9SPHI|nr:PAS domain-containing sensor histidine kinase [Sphingobacterium sp. CFCC 11742]
MSHRNIDSQQLLSILCQSSQPVAVYTGEDILIEFANHAMLTVWGEDKNVIGKTIAEVLPKITDESCSAIMRRVWDSGIEYIAEGITADLVIDCELQRFYFDHQFQAIKNEYGDIYAILHTALDVTDKVKSKIEAHHQATLFRELVQQAPVAITVLYGEKLIIDIVNPKMLEIWGKDNQIIGMPIADAIPELDGQPFVDILLNVLHSGIPYYGRENWIQLERNGKISEGYFNFDCKPFKNGDGEVIGVLQVVTEVTDHVMSRLEIQQTKTMMDMAITAANLGTWQMELQTKTIVHNESLLRILGYHQAPPMTFEMVMNQVSPYYRAKLYHSMEQALKNRSKFDIIYSLKRFDDAELIWIRAFGKISDSSEQLETFSGFIMDITETVKDEQRKNDFIGMVSHELKTPLTSIYSYAQLLSRHADRKHDEYVSKIAGAAVMQLSKMTAMINGFLNFSRFESGKITLDRSVFDITDLIHEILEEHQITSSTHQIIFDNSVKCKINADRIKIGIVISNLFNNAIKYSHKGSAITVKCKQIGDRIELCVIDTGIGISEDHIDKIFDRFYRVRSEFVSGFGIGLYLSSEIVHSHQGKIWAISTLGKGSSFFINMPTSLTT